MCSFSFIRYEYVLLTLSLFCLFAVLFVFSVYFRFKSSHYINLNVNSLLYVSIHSLRFTNKKLTFDAPQTLFFIIPTMYSSSQSKKSWKGPQGFRTFHNLMVFDSILERSTMFWESHVLERSKLLSNISQHSRIFRVLLNVVE